MGDGESILSYLERVEGAFRSEHIEEDCYKIDTLRQCLSGKALESLLTITRGVDMRSLSNSHSHKYL